MKEIKKDYSQIQYCIVLAYMPLRNNNLYKDFYECTIYPDGLEKTPAKFAILKRNEWMVKKSDILLCYIRFTFGGAYKTFEIAKRAKKKIINLSD